MVEVIDTRLRGGHVYIELSERAPDGTVLAKSNAVIWASNAIRILPEFERATGATIGPGIKMLVGLGIRRYLGWNRAGNS
jgi:exodeoxyribonuclease VII large subunit